MSHRFPVASMFDEREYLDVARHLRVADPREGFQRSAISRAYYAVFLYARRTFRERTQLPQSGGGSDHRAVADALTQLDPDLAEQYISLRRLRNSADYSVDRSDPDELADDAQLAIDLAESIRTRLGELT